MCQKQKNNKYFKKFREVSGHSGNIFDSKSDNPVSILN